MKVIVQHLGHNCFMARVGPKTWRGSDDFRKLLEKLNIKIDRLVLNSEEVDIFLPSDQGKRRTVIKEIEDFLNQLENK